MKTRKKGRVPDVIQKLKNSKAAKDTFQKLSNVLRDWKITLETKKRVTGQLCLV